jgi:hypothetical protein
MTRGADVIVRRGERNLRKAANRTSPQRRHIGVLKRRITTLEKKNLELRRVLREIHPTYGCFHGDDCPVTAILKDGEVDPTLDEALEEGKDAMPAEER